MFSKREQKLPNPLSRSLHYTLLLLSGAWFVLLMSLPAHIATAQRVGQTSEGITSFSIKVSSISPAAGVSYGISSTSELRLLGFITTYSNLSPHDNQLFLDLSYLRYTEWISNNSFNPYWGLNLNMLAEEPLIGPGALLGTSYYLSSKFAIFAEVGLNAFIDGNGSSTIGLHNSGIGISINL